MWNEKSFNSATHLSRIPKYSYIALPPLYSTYIPLYSITTTLQKFLCFKYSLSSRVPYWRMCWSPQCVTLTSSVCVGVTVMLIYNLVIVGMHSQVIKFNWTPAVFSKYFSQKICKWNAAVSPCQWHYLLLALFHGNYFVEMKGQVFTVENNMFLLVNEVCFRATVGKQKLVIKS